MICKVCGNELQETDKFCSKCGSKTSHAYDAEEKLEEKLEKKLGEKPEKKPEKKPEEKPEEKPEKKLEEKVSFEDEPKKIAGSKSKGAIIGISCLITVVLIGVGIFFYIQNNQLTEQRFSEAVEQLETMISDYDLKDNKEYEELLDECEDALFDKDKSKYSYLENKIKSALEEGEETHELITEMPEKMEAYRKQWGQLIVEDSQAFDQLMSQLKEAIKSANQKEISQLCEEVEALQEEIAKSNKKDIENERLEIEELATNYMNSGEKQLGLTLQDELTDFLSQGDYIRAKVALDKWRKYVEAFNGNSDYSMIVEQVDVSQFPQVKLYLRVEDKRTGESIATLSSSDFYLFEQMHMDEDFVRKEINKAVQLNEVENLNINIVADVSGSMIGVPLMTAQEIMQRFVSNIQFRVGDKAAVTSFADQVYANVGFTSDQSSVYNAVNSLSTGNMTALYDALYVAINQTAMQEGAKCVIAFTDGRDNISSCSPTSVAEFASRYKIPIYIIGVGNSLNTYELNYIAEQTGGFYRNVYDISSMEDIYGQIYRKQKELYLLEYETSNANQADVVRNLVIDYINDNFIIKNEYQFVPAVYMEATTAMAQLFVNDFIIYDSDTRYLTAADLHSLTQEQLRIARNEIYARQGRKFLDEELQTYFDSKGWYSGTIEPDAFQEERLNEYEKANAYFIRDYERLKGYLS